MRNEVFKKDMAKSVRKFYFDDKPVGLENISNFVDVSKLNIIKLVAYVIQ